VSRVLTWTPKGPGPGVQPVLPKKPVPFARWATVSSQLSPPRPRRDATLTAGSLPPRRKSKTVAFHPQPEWVRCCGAEAPHRRARWVPLSHPEGWFRVARGLHGHVRRSTRDLAARLDCSTAPKSSFLVRGVHFSAPKHTVASPNGFSLPIPKDRSALPGGGVRRPAPKDRLASPWEARPRLGRSPSRLAAR